MPPAPVQFPKNAIMEWNNIKITDHNRSSVGVNVDRIGTDKRMANGTLRRYVIADKRSFDVSWDDLPSDSAWTVDGFLGGKDIEAFYNNNAGQFILTLTHGDGVRESFTVVFTDFNKDITKRGAYDFWNLSVTMEEV